MIMSRLKPPRPGSFPITFGLVHSVECWIALYSSSAAMLRRAIVTVLVAAVFLVHGGAGQAQAQTPATFIQISVGDPDVTSGTFLSNAQSLFDLNGLDRAAPPATEYEREYVAVFFRVSDLATPGQTYVFGQTFSDVDTVMFLVDGVFDPQNPRSGAIVLNYDTDAADHRATLLTTTISGSNFDPMILMASAILSADRHE
jgi:hypothetical protein